jgi:hypothetical protein
MTRGSVAWSSRRTTSAIRGLSHTLLQNSSKLTDYAVF